MFNGNEAGGGGGMKGRLELQSVEMDYRLIQFRQSHATWIDQRFEETEIVCAFPHFDEYKWKFLFHLSEDEIETEKKFSEICDDLGVFAIGRNQDCLSELIVRRESLFSITDYLDIMSEDWDGDQVDRNIEALQEAEENSIGTRLAGVAGWMVCNPKFIEECKTLKSLWEKLPADKRPEFPLHRTPLLSTKLPRSRKVRASSPLGFWKKFDAFCDYWRLLGMITWYLPNPDGPKLSGLILPNSREWEGEVIPGIPWQFPILGEDGIGLAKREEHAGQAEGFDFDDQKSWKTYSQILRINFWEQTVNSRYSDILKPKSFISQLLDVLETVIGINVDRIKKLRKTRNRLQSGKIKSLKGTR